MRMHMIHESTSMRSSGEREDSTHNEQFATVGGVDKSLVDEAGVLRLDSGSNASALSFGSARLTSAFMNLMNGIAMGWHGIEQFPRQ